MRSAVIVFLLIICSNPVFSENKEHELLVKIDRNGANEWTLHIMYINESKSAFCVRHSDWSENIMYTIQLFNEDEQRIAPKFEAYFIKDAIDTARNPIFVIVLPGQSIQQAHNLNEFYQLGNKSFTNLSVKMAIPFVKCGVFEREYIEMPQATVLDPKITISKSWVMKEESLLKEYFLDWYKNGYIAYGEGIWRRN